jgi:hypothetical protein
MRKLQEKEKYIVDRTGTKTDVIIPLNEYEELLEDIHDLAIIAERIDEPTMSLKELKRKLQVNGIIWDSLEKICWAWY